MAEEQRDYAKQLAYGLLYGKGPHALAVDLSCDVKKAAKQQESFMRAIPNVVSVTSLLFLSIVSLLALLLFACYLQLREGRLHCQWSSHLQCHCCAVMNMTALPLHTSCLKE